MCNLCHILVNFLSKLSTKKIAIVEITFTICAKEAAAAAAAEAEKRQDHDRELAAHVTRRGARTGLGG